MIYLSGKIVKCTPHIGVMLSFNAGKQRTVGHKIFAADNGCFAQAKKYTDDGFLEWLNGLQRKHCLFAVAPDVVGAAVATRDRAYPILPHIRKLGFKGAFVLQDGETPDQIRWHDIDAVFVGGSTKWKLSQAAAEIVQEAKKRGKWAHMGRVNSFKRMRLAKIIGCDSVDGTFLAFAPDKNAAVLSKWMRDLHQQQKFNFTERANERINTV